MKILRRYWFSFEKFVQPTPLNLGCGVTAYCYSDALSLMSDRVFAGSLPRITGFIEDVDVSNLDRNHVLPNIGMVNVRGIWFPQGY
jgi:hypothetical protein